MPSGLECPFDAANDEDTPPMGPENKIAIVDYTQYRLKKSDFKFFFVLAYPGMIHDPSGVKYL